MLVLECSWFSTDVAITFDEFSNATCVPLRVSVVGFHYDVLDSDKHWAEKTENALNHVLVAVVLFVIVGSTIKLLLPKVITALVHVGSATR